MLALSAEVVYSVVVLAALVGTMAFTALGAAPPITEPTLLSDDGTACVIADGELRAADPEALAKGMGMDPGAYALARVIESEAGTLGEIDKIAVAWVVVNAARASGVSVLRKITRATRKVGGERIDGAGDGYFGKQGDPVGGYRYVSSAQDSTDDSRRIGAAVLGGDYPDPTDGAVNFDAPGAYGAQEGTEEGGADTFASNRASEGKVQIDVPGASGRVRYWGFA